MISEYFKFDADKFVKDAFKFKASLGILEQQLDDMDGYPRGVSSEKVKSSPTNSFENLIVARDELREKINKKKRVIAIFDRAMSQLGEDDRFVINTFYDNKKSKVSRVVSISERFMCSESKVYELRARALEKLKEYII